MQSYKTLSSDIFTPSTNGHWSTLGTTGHYTANRIVIPVQSAHVPRLSHQSVLATIIDNPSIDDDKPVQPWVPVSEYIEQQHFKPCTQSALHVGLFIGIDEWTRLPIERIYCIQVPKGYRGTLCFILSNLIVFAFPCAVYLARQQ